MKHPHYDNAMWYFSDPKNNKVQFFRFRTQQWEDVEDPTFHASLRFRRKPVEPNRIKINGVEINAPLSESPDKSVNYWLVSYEQIHCFTWDGSWWEEKALANGRIFATEQDAQAAYDAITMALTGVNK